MTVGRILRRYAEDGYRDRQRQPRPEGTRKSEADSCEALLEYWSAVEGDGVTIAACDRYHDWRCNDGLQQTISALRRWKQERFPNSPGMFGETLGCSPNAPGCGPLACSFSPVFSGVKWWSERQDLNLRRLGHKPSLGVSSSVSIAARGCIIVSVIAPTYTRPAQWMQALFCIFVQIGEEKAVSGRVETKSRVKTVSG